MLSIPSVVCALALAATALASPKQVCAKDACYVAVGANFNKGGTERLAGCASYMMTTVTPNPVTITSATTTTTSTTVTSTITSTALVTNLSTLTSTVVTSTTEVDKTTTTVEVDVTTVKTKEIDATKTVPGTKTIQTTVFTTVPALQKRKTGCPFAGVQTNSIPSYAMACTNAKSYASACSCFGATAASTTTLPACTTTVYTTATATATRTAFKTATVTSTVQATVTKLKTSTQVVTQEKTIVVSSTSTKTLTTSSTDFIATATSIATTVTKTFTSTATAKPTSCNNQGLQFAVYTNIDGPNNPTKANPDYAAFKAQDYATMQPVCTGVTTSIGGISYSSSSSGSGASLSIYNQCKVSPTNYVINHQGYIYAPISGTYNFKPSAADDLLAVWFDTAVAYKGYTRGNDNIDLTQGQQPMPFQITLKGGKYYPLRVMFAQAQGGADFGLTVSLPNGTQILGSKTKGSGYVVQSACGGSAVATPFPAFGHQG